jgi:hypothetical protein
MRYTAIISGIFAFILFGIYTLAFTPLGNSIVAPFIESKIRHETKIASKLTTFVLNMSSFEIVLELSPSNIVSANGNYSLFSRAFDIAYRAKLDQLSDLHELAGVPIIGTIFTEGHIKGDMDLMQIDGLSDIAKSETTYHIELTQLHPTSLLAKVKHADLLSLLQLGGQKPYASAQVDMDIDFKNIMPHALDGVLHLQTHNGKIDTKLMRSDFNVTIPEMAFSMNVDAKLERERIDFVYALHSNLAKIESSGKIIPQPFSMNVKYNLDIEELAVLKPFTNASLRGPLNILGEAKGTKERLKIDGKSDICASNTSFVLEMKDFKPATLQAKMDNLKLEKVLYMMQQPHYADGLLSLDVDISDARSKSLKGNIKTNITHGLLDSQYISKAFAFKSEMPKTLFDLSAQSVLGANSIQTQVTLNTNLATLSMQKLLFDTNDMSINTDYKFSAQNLDAFYFLTQRHMRGALVAEGRVKKSKDLDVTLHSNIMSGTLEVKLHNDELYAELKSLQTQSILHTLLYPEIFEASLSGAFAYNLLADKGTFEAKFADGLFSKNEIFTLIKHYGILDMYAERFHGDINAKINKEFIVASLELLSNKSSIKTQQTKLNSKTKAIDSELDLVVNNNPISASIQGTTDAPKVSVDLERFMKSKAGDAVKKEVNKFLKGLF